MSGFLYFLPGKTTVSAEELKTIGIDYAFANVGLKHKTPVNNGPDGKHGLIVSCQKRNESRLNRYAKDQQSWEVHEAGGYWVGMWNDQRPAPEDLERDDKLPGLKVKLGDGNEWVVPMARRWSMEDDPEAWPQAMCELPSRIRFNTGAGDKIEVGGVQQKYAHLWAISQLENRLRYRKTTPEDDAMLTGEQLMLSALAVLQVNYAIGPAEANLLDLFVTDTWQAVFDALNDVAAWRAMIEKKTIQMATREKLAASPSSSNGQEATPQSTDPQLQTC